MKNSMIKIVLYIARGCMSILYFFIKLFTRQKNKVTMLSRQSNHINLDFRLLKEELEREENNVQIKVLCKMIPKTFLGKIEYCFYIIKCMYHIATSKVCIIDGYNIVISALKQKKNLEVIQIWHAMGAIKKFGYQVLDKKEGRNSIVANIMKMHANYTCITCISEETRKIYAEAFRTDMNKIKVLGMPRIDYLLGKNNEIDRNIEKLYQDYPELKKKKNIVYVPTFRKGKKIDIDKIIHAIDREKYNLIIRLHPLDKTEIDEKYLVDKKYSTSDLIKASDYVITDYSAVALEAAAIDKILFFYLFDLNEYEIERGLNINLQKEMGSSTKNNIEEIIEIIEKNTYHYEELKQFKEKYVQTADKNNSKRIVEYMKKVLDGNV